MADAADPSSIFKNEEKCLKWIKELKSLARPPQGVADTMFAVSLLMGEDPSWRGAQKMMSNPPSFFNMLKTFDMDNVKPEVIENVREYTSKQDFNPESVKKQCLACEFLCKWVIAIERNFTNK